jgi:L-fucose mutarotase/ribose pyranase (RbsD/FucU family)
MLTNTGDHVAFWLADANHPAHTSAPVRIRTNATTTSPLAAAVLAGDV